MQKIHPDYETRRFTMSVNENLWEEFKQWAEKSETSVANAIRLLMRNEVEAAKKQHGFKPVR